MNDIQTVYPKVAKIIANVLAVDESNISLDKRLIEDLGAESIDFMDLIFQLEREFGVKIPRGQVEKEVRGKLQNDEFEKNGVITPKGLEALKNYLSEVPEKYFKSNLKSNEISRLFTVETFCKLVIKEKAKQTESVNV